jgi:hypothetical protein
MLNPIKRLWCRLIGHQWTYTCRDANPIDIAGVCTRCDHGATYFMGRAFDWREGGYGFGREVSAKQWFELDRFWRGARAAKDAGKLKEDTDA